MNKCEISKNVCSLNGYKIGNGCSNNVLDEHRYGLGYYIRIKEGAVLNFSLFLSIDKRDQISSVFEGDVTLGGDEMGLTENTQPEAIRSLLGEPETSWNDEVEINMQFIYGNYRLEFSWDKERDNQLHYLGFELA